MLFSNCVVTNVLWAVVHPALMDTNGPRVETRGRLGVFCLVGYGIPLAMTMIPLVRGRFGHSGDWCWVMESPDDWLDRIIAFYMWIFFGVTYNIVICAVILVHLRRTSMRARGFVRHTQLAHHATQMRSVVVRYAAYPLISALVWSFAIAHRIYNLVHPGESVPALTFAHTISTPLQGFLDSFVFVFSMGALRKWWRLRAELATVAVHGGSEGAPAPVSDGYASLQ